MIQNVPRLTLTVLFYFIFSLLFCKDTSEKLKLKHFNGSIIWYQKAKNMDNVINNYITRLTFNLKSINSDCENQSHLETNMRNHKEALEKNNILTYSVIHV